MREIRAYGYRYELTSDVFCGEACGNICCSKSPFNFEKCVDGKCTKQCELLPYNPPPEVIPPPSTCPGGYTCCPSSTPNVRVCWDLSNDPNNCGSCGHKCNSGEICHEKNCVIPQCDPPCSIYGPDFKCCSPNFCADTKNNPHFCGSCNNQCPQGFECKNSQCVLPPCNPPCTLSEMCCEPYCVDKENDKNCGECGKDCTAEGKICFSYFLPNGDKVFECRDEKGCCIFGEGICADMDHRSDCLGMEGLAYVPGQPCSTLTGCNAQS